VLTWFSISSVAIFRWVNTAVVITIITPFTSTLSSATGGLIDQIYAQFFAEIVTTTVIQLVDVYGHFQRHFLAPRAATQDSMNVLMQGTEVELAERYTNMTKMLFLTLWYCAIFPSSFFMCSVAMLVNYFLDRFSLMRTWKRPSLLGPQMVRNSISFVRLQSQDLNPLTSCLLLISERPISAVGTSSPWRSLRWQ
jgi:hypothetical protein